MGVKRKQHAPRWLNDFLEIDDGNRQPNLTYLGNPLLALYGRLAAALLNLLGAL